MILSPSPFLKPVLQIRMARLPTAISGTPSYPETAYAMRGLRSLLAGPPIIAPRPARPLAALYYSDCCESLVHFHPPLRHL